MNEQCQQSREQGLDGLSDFPSPLVKLDLERLGLGSRAYDMSKLLNVQLQKSILTCSNSEWLHPAS